MYPSPFVSGHALPPLSQCLLDVMANYVVVVVVYLAYVRPNPTAR